MKRLLYLLMALSYTFLLRGQQIIVKQSTSVDYDVIPSDAASWNTQTTTRVLQMDRLSFRIEANIENADRTAKIAIKDKKDNLSDPVTVIQPTEQNNIIWKTEQDLIDFKATGQIRVKGNIIVQGNEIKTLQKLDNLLTEIDGSLTLECFSLTSLDGLYGLTKITGDLIVREGKMIYFEGLGNLTTIGKSFKITAHKFPSSLSSLLSFKGLSRLKNIGENFVVSTFAGCLNRLESFEGLENLETIGGNFYVDVHSSGFTNSLTSLTSFNGLRNLKSVGGNFVVSTYSGPNSNSLTALESFEGLESLGTIGGNFELFAVISPPNNYNSNYYSNSLTAFTSFKGLSGLKSIGGNFKIGIVWFTIPSGSAFTSLRSFEGLENLRTIGGNFEISAKRDVGGYCFFNSLTSFDGLNRLKNIGGDFAIDTYQCKIGFESFKGLENLETIGGDFKVSTTSSYYPSPLNSFKGLENLVTIGKKLTIEDCKTLTTIAALSKVSSLEEITIEGCDKLYDFCALKNVVQNMNGTFYVATCGYNPTKYQLLNGECSQTPPASDNN